MNNNDKTIPYNPSTAELEKIRLLGKKFKSFDSEIWAKEDKTPPEAMVKDPDPGSIKASVEKKTS